MRLPRAAQVERAQGVSARWDAEVARWSTELAAERSALVVRAGWVGGSAALTPSCAHIRAADPLYIVI